MQTTLVTLNLPENKEDFKVQKALGLTDDQFEAIAEKLAAIDTNLIKGIVTPDGGIRNNMELLIELNKLSAQELLILASVNTYQSAKLTISEHPEIVLASIFGNMSEEDDAEEQAAPSDEQGVYEAPRN